MAQGWYRGSERHSLKNFLRSWLINTLAVWVAVYIVSPHIRFTDDSVWTPFMVALVLGVLNAFFRPILRFLALPLLLITLGLFTLVINAFLLFLVSVLLSGHFHIDSFGWALLGSLLISTVSVLLNYLVGGESKVRVVHRRKPPQDSDGPVIDV
jgi:putative membrane protein